MAFSSEHIHQAVRAALKAERPWRLCNVSRAQTVPVEAGPGTVGGSPMLGVCSAAGGLRSCLLRDSNRKRKEFGKNCSFGIS